jgi:hypothetical protein
MTYGETIDKIKLVIDSCTSANVEFVYGRVWDMNIDKSKTFPRFLVECQPNFDFKGLQHNNKMGGQTFKGKFFLFDIYHQSERATKKLWDKQSEMNELMLGLCAEIVNKTNPTMKIGGGFFGWFEQHNAKLVEVYVPFEFQITDCGLQEFTYV